MSLTREQVAKRAARELRNGDYVNLGVGIPTLVANYIPPDIEVLLHSGHGVLGLGPFPEPDEIDPDLVSVDILPATLMPGAAVFPTIDSFGMVRGGKLDVAILGAMEVSERGDIANWMAPNSPPRGMGGAMDLVVGVKRLIVTMEHTTRDGTRRIVNECALPLTGVGCVDRIITDLCVLDVTPKGLVLRELAPGLTVADVQAATEPHLMVPEEPQVIAL
jgi:3-oxoacid CoA-transferase subunit B